MLADPLFIIAVVACGIVAAILGFGISTFGKEGVETAKKANKLMQLRLFAQFAAVILILLFVMVRGG